MRRTALPAVLVPILAVLAGSGLVRPSTATALTPTLDRNGFGAEVVTICDRASSELDSLKNLNGGEEDRASFVAYFTGLDRILVRMDTKLAKLRVTDAAAKAIVTTSRSALAYERKMVKTGLARGRAGSVIGARDYIDAAYVEVERREQAVNGQLVSIALDECSFFPTTRPDDTPTTSTAPAGPVVFGLDPTDAAIVLPSVGGFTLTVLPEDARALPVDDVAKALIERYDGRLVYGANGKPVGALIAMKLRVTLAPTEADAFLTGLFGSLQAQPVDLPATGAFKRVQLAQSGTKVSAGGVQGRWGVAFVGTEPVGAKQFVAAYFPSVPVLPA